MFGIPTTPDIGTEETRKEMCNARQLPPYDPPSIRLAIPQTRLEDYEESMMPRRVVPHILREHQVHKV